MKSTEKMLLKICPIFLLLLVNSHAYEITGGSPDTLVASGDSLSLTCDIDGGDYNLCQWSYVGGDWDCMTYSNALNEELSCTSNDRAKVTGTESSCSVSFGVYILSSEINNLSTNRPLVYWLGPLIFSIFERLFFFETPNQTNQKD